MSRFFSLGLVLVAVLCLTSFTSFTSVAHGSGSINIGSSPNGSSGSSGSSGSHKSGDAPVVRQSVSVGKVKVLVPVGDDDSEVVQAEDGSVVWEYKGRQVLCTEVHDVFAALRITEVQVGTIGDWTFRYASNGSTVVYVAAHKQSPSLYVQGTAASEAEVKEVLKLVQVVKPKESKDSKDAKDSKDSREPKPAK